MKILIPNKYPTIYNIYTQSNNSNNSNNLNNLDLNNISIFNK